jgi:hypothetical protein
MQLRCNRPTMNRRAIPAKPAEADLSRLCMDSAGVHPRAEMNRARSVLEESEKISEVPETSDI